jgi:hypothetical protein
MLRDCHNAGGQVGRLFAGPMPRARRESLPPGAKQRCSRRPCHPRAISSGHERSPADNHGHSKEAIGLDARSLTWGEGNGRNCMACKGSGVQRTFDSGPQSQGTGTPKVALGPVANTVLRSEAPARAPDEELSQGQSNGVMPICVRAARRLRAHTPWRPP